MTESHALVDLDSNTHAGSGQIESASNGSAAGNSPMPKLGEILFVDSPVPARKVDLLDYVSICC